jgi:hypothetical protein
MMVDLVLKRKIFGAQANVLLAIFTTGHPLLFSFVKKLPRACMVCGRNKNPFINPFHPMSYTNEAL